MGECCVYCRFRRLRQRLKRLQTQNLSLYTEIRWDNKSANQNLQSASPHKIPMKYSLDTIQNKLLLIIKKQLAAKIPKNKKFLIILQNSYGTITVYIKTQKWLQILLFWNQRLANWNALMKDLMYFWMKPWKVSHTD